MCVSLLADIEANAGMDELGSGNEGGSNEGGQGGCVPVPFARCRQDRYHVCKPGPCRNGFIRRPYSLKSRKVIFFSALQEKYCLI